MAIEPLTPGAITEKAAPSSSVTSVGDDAYILQSEHVEGSKMSTEVNRAGHPSARDFTWKIQGFSKSGANRHYSEIFSVEGYKWRVLMFPDGSSPYLSIYLYAVDLSDDRRRFARFSVTLISHLDDELSIEIESKQEFHIHRRYWGFESFMPLSELYNPACGYLIDDTVIIQVVIRMIKDAPYNSKNEADYAFSMNQEDRSASLLHAAATELDINDMNGYYSSDSSNEPGSDGSRNQEDDDLMDFFQPTYNADTDRVNKKINYDSKKETGYVGLRNQGATCYMNSLLQTLYHIPLFRKAVYQMPKTQGGMSSASIPLALQSLFFKLQHDDTSVATEDLTKSLGWSRDDSFVQRDIQEFNRFLFEKLEDKMQELWCRGQYNNYLKGTTLVTYSALMSIVTPKQMSPFVLDVKGCKDVYASLDKYVEVENLHGDNKYYSEKFGLQDAKKVVLFIDFPSVLQLQLKRFEYDINQERITKVNDHYEFPPQLDLDRDSGRYLSSDADRRIRNLYTLHSVLVHRGEVQNGHYYAFIRPQLSGQWYMFDDEVVTKVDTKRALDEQYGGELKVNLNNNDAPAGSMKASNAYMLVYIRESDKDKILCDVDGHSTEHLRIRLDVEKEKNDKMIEQTDTELYAIIKVAWDEDLQKQIGWDIIFDLVDHDEVQTFRIRKKRSFHVFKDMAAKFYDIPVQFQRFWLWDMRENLTHRPKRPISPSEERYSVGQVMTLCKNASNDELKLFLEVELGLDMHPLPLPERNKGEILLFFKLYDPKKEQLEYVGRLFVRLLERPADILTKLNKMAGFQPDEEILLYEEVQFEPLVVCKDIDKRVSFYDRGFQDGDIICYERPPVELKQIYYPDVPSFLAYVHSQQNDQALKNGDR